MRVEQVYFSNTTRDIQEQCFPWAAPRTRPVSNCTLVAPKVTTEGRRGSNTLGPLLPVFGKQTPEVDYLDLANTALKSPPHCCQLLTHASDDKNATLDDWMKWREENDLSDGMRSEVIPILYFTRKHSHRET